jgi:hypothetical protein
LCTPDIQFPFSFPAKMIARHNDQCNTKNISDSSAIPSPPGASSSKRSHIACFCPFG